MRRRSVAARQFAGIPRNMGQRPQSRRRLPRPRPLAARQTLAVGDLRCPSLPARRRQRAGDLARAGLVQARHVRTLAAQRTLHRTACAGTTGHRHRKHLADRLPHGHRMACRAERLPRHGVVERPRLRRRRDRHLHRPWRRPGAVLQQVQPPCFPLRRGARTGAEAPPGGFPGARHPHRLPARSDVHFVG